MSAWTEYTSPDGRAYYYNRETRVTSWEKPDELKTPQERASVWKEYAKDGKPYWYNTVTKKSTWTRPVELAPASTAPAPAPAPAPVPVLVPMPVPVPAIVPALATEPVKPGPQSAVPNSQPPYQPKKSNRLEFQTTEEAEKAFMDMLHAHGVTGNWTWQQTVRTVSKDPMYHALRSAQERRDAFDRYIDRTLEKEREERRQRQKKQREDFNAMMSTLPISEYTRFSKVAKVAANHPAMQAVERESDQMRLFDEYMDEYRHKLKEERRKTKAKQMQEVAEFLSQVTISTKWEDMKKKLVERFQDSLMPVVRSDDQRVPLDTLHLQTDASAVDPEAGLTMLDLIDVFERAMSEAEQRDSEQRRREKEAMFREERIRRDRFRELLRENKAKITPVMTWKEFFPLIRTDPRYTEMLGQSGSTPLELFWDEVELLNEDMYHDRKKLEAIMRDRGFRVLIDTPLSEVEKFARDHTTMAMDNLTYIHEQLMLKAVRRKEEEEERNERHRRRLLDDFKYALYYLDPPISADTTWEAVQAKVYALPEFKDVGDEKACRATFDQVVDRMKEKVQQKKRRQESLEAEARKRSRSPVVGGSATESRSTKPRTEEDYSSELEEGEMPM
ncbi:U1 snRNP protein [Linderina pennispora]|nr:U1 snRNP protein [Linderina pennispora]